jgi:ATP-dependent Clp protease ATP-binding subunit ClpC
VVGLVSVAQTLKDLDGQGDRGLVYLDRLEATLQGGVLLDVLTHHKITITDEAITSAANLASRYIQDRFLPDKAIDLIDEAGFFSSSRNPAARSKSWASMAASFSTRTRAIRSSNSRRSGGEKKLLAEREAKEEEWKQGDESVPAVVGPDEIAEVLSGATGIPVFKLTEEESQRLLHMEDEIDTRRASKNERTCRTLRILEAGAGASDRAAQGLDGVLLAGCW